MMTWQNGRVTTDIDGYHGGYCVTWTDTETGRYARWYGTTFAACRNRAMFPPPRDGEGWAAA